MSHRQNIPDSNMSSIDNKTGDQTCRAEQINTHPNNVTLPSNNSETAASKAKSALKKHFVGPHMLQELKKGPKVNIFIGSEDDMYIGIEGAYVKLLSHFCIYARHGLIKEGASSLLIPYARKEHVVWIYKYMLSGENTTEDMTNFNDLALEELIWICRHCDRLGYTSLMERCMERITEILYENVHKSLPPPELIKDIVTFIPGLTPSIASVVALDMLFPWEGAFVSYLNNVVLAPGFDMALGDEMERVLTRRIRAGELYYNGPSPNRHVAWSNKYYESLVQSSKVNSLPPSQNRSMSRSTTTNAAEANGTAAQLKRQPLKDHGPVTNGENKANTTNNSSIPGDNAPKIKVRKNPPRTPKCYNCGVVGHPFYKCPEKATNGTIKFESRGASNQLTIIDNQPQLTVKKATSAPNGTVKDQVKGGVGERVDGPTETQVQNTAGKSNKNHRRHPWPKVCHRCREKGHFIRDCPLSRLKAPSDSSKGNGQTQKDRVM